MGLAGDVDVGVGELGEGLGGWSEADQARRGNAREEAAAAAVKELDLRKRRREMDLAGL